MPVAEKKFVLTHVVKNILSMKENEYWYGALEEHFNAQWRIFVQRNKKTLGFYLSCQNRNSSKWSIDTERVQKVLSVNGKTTSSAKVIKTFQPGDSGWGWSEFIKWEDMKKDYMIDGNVIIEAHVKILKMTGIEKKKLINFDESMKNLSDAVLIVNDRKFHVLKLYLSFQSTYFEALFLKNFKESEKSEIILKDVDSKDFQNFLELLYGESPIDEDTVEGIVKLANIYDAKLAIQKCEEFLINESDKTSKEKLQIAKKYNLKKLKNECLSKTNTAVEIRSVLSYDTNEMDPSVVGALLQKSLSLIP